MSRTLQNLARFTPIFRSHRPGPLLAITAIALLAVACGSAASGHTQPSGTLTGYVVMAGGPGPHLDKHGHWVREQVAGTVSVFDSHEKKVAHTTVRASQPFHFTLPAGHYQLNQGTKLNFPRDCHPVSATVRPSATTHIDVSTGCWIP